MEQSISREMEFFMYLIEQYAAFKQKPTGDVMREWDALGITELIYDMYERYHVERIEMLSRTSMCWFVNGGTPKTKIGLSMAREACASRMLHRKQWGL